MLSFWPVLGARVVGDQRVRSLRACLDWTRRAGYDGVELSVSDIKALFFSPDTPLEEVVRDTNAAAKAAGVEIFGGTYHLVDGNKWTYAGEVTESSPCRDGMRQRPMFDVDQSGWRDELRANFAHDKAMGCGYATFQVFLPERHLNTGGAYRRDKAYLQQCADRIGVIQRLCWEEGLNCYIETHIERITEDLEAFNEIMDLAPEGLELNADLSH